MLAPVLRGSGCFLYWWGTEVEQLNPAKGSHHPLDQYPHVPRALFLRKPNQLQPKEKSDHVGKHGMWKVQWRDSRVAGWSLGTLSHWSLCPGSYVLVHSSTSTFAQVEDGHVLRARHQWEAREGAVIRPQGELWLGIRASWQVLWLGYWR